MVIIMGIEFDRMEFGRRLKETRENKRMSKKSLAQHIGVSLSQICHYEDGDDLPKYEKLKSIACFLDISVDYLLDIPQKNSMSVEKTLSEQQKLLIDLIINSSSRDAELLSALIPSMINSLKLYRR